MAPRTVLVATLSLALLALGAWWIALRADSAPVADEPRQPPRPQTVEPRVPPLPLAPGSAPQGLPLSGPGWFTDMTAASGVDFVHQSGTNAEKPFPAANGSGVASLDYDLDGRCDLYFATGTPFPLDPARREPTNRFYRNRGDWNFDDVTEFCGLGHAGYSAGLAVGDFDADGFPDVAVACFGANCLFRNQGDGTYERIEQAAGVADARWATSAAFFDYNDDGRLDLFFANYAKWSWETRQFCGDRARNIRIYCSPSTVEPEQSVLYRNQGDGTFFDATVESGLAVRTGRAQGVIAADLNGDGAIDLYVANDQNPNSLFLNRGKGIFEDATELSGAAYDFAGRSQAGMGVDVGDVDGDGRPELFVTNFQDEHNTLYRNQGSGLFQDISYRSGLADESLPWIGWGTALADFDLDGWLDVVVTNGHVDDNRHLLGQEGPYAQPPLAWRNRQGQFEFLGAAAGEFFTQPRVGRGLAAADLDNDGDQDLVIVHQDDPPALLRNDAPTESGGSRGALAVRLIGVHANRDVVGASLSLSEGDHVMVRQRIGGGSYLSAHEQVQYFGVSSETSLSLHVRWPGGGEMTIPVVSGRKYVVIESSTPSELPAVYSWSYIDEQ